MRVSATRPLFFPQNQYVGLAYASTGGSPGDELPPGLLRDIQMGEHGHSVLQALCRASVRGSDGDKCKPCEAYIIASKTSGIRDALPEWFPGCRVKTWKPRHKPLQGQVQKAVLYIERRLSVDPGAVISFGELMGALEIPNKSNFNRTIRKHEDFQAAVQCLGLEEVAIDGSRHKTALRRVWEADTEEEDLDADLWDF